MGVNRNGAPPCLKYFKSLKYYTPLKYYTGISDVLDETEAALSFMTWGAEEPHWLEFQATFIWNNFLSSLAKSCSKAIVIATEEKLHELDEKLLETCTCDTDLKLGSGGGLLDLHPLTDFSRVSNFELQNEAALNDLLINLVR
ncbi:hypothetical protein TNCV_1737481 [Trichonephila clavipes]|nr:hypothetical protein TNCV_1737481 [Trichonephila clavipes]